MNTENNKIIAEFMGEKTFNSPFLVFDIPQHVRENEKLENGASLFGMDKLRYYSDWNWLMEVVEKIETLKYYKKDIQFSITKYSVSIQTLANKNGVVIGNIFSAWGTYEGTEKKLAIYRACIEFIKWYNEQTN
jgi:hypothetical protein